MDLVAAAVTFGTIFVVELPDKTFIAALVLSTRYRPLAVWLGVGLAFGVQTTLAVTAGALTTLLPQTLVMGVALGIFLLGAFLLFRTARGADDQERESEQEYAAGAGTGTRSFAKAVGASFLVLFAAEWGDLSQLLTISLVGRYDAASVFAGAWAALLTVSGLAVIAGRLLLRRLRPSVLHYLGGSVCLVLAALTAYEIAVR